MNDLYYLNLPPLPTDIKKELISFAKHIPDDVAGKEWIEQFHNHTIRAASQVYGKVALDKDLQNEITSIYAPYIKGNFQGIIGIFKNTYGSGVVEHPAHCDRTRKIAINNILDAGGTNVLTCFYNNDRKSTDLSQAENCLHDELTLDKKLCLPADTWHAFNVQKYHSIENIENLRILFSLVLDSNPDINTFKNDYSNIIKQ